VYFEKQRLRLIEYLEQKGICDKGVLHAIKNVPRHAFVPAGLESQAYHDKALPIGFGQTISHPYTVAKMTEALQVKRGDKVLEIGTGSGYQCAVLCELGAHVYTIEIEKNLALKAQEKLTRLKYRFALRIGDGKVGWPEYAPYDAIIVTAAASVLPEKLLEQLKIDGRLIIPQGSHQKQLLTLYVKKVNIIERYQMDEYKFVPLTGKV